MIAASNRSRAIPPKKPRVIYLTHSQYLDQWERLRAALSPEAVRQGAHRDLLEATAKGVLRVDEAFLRDMENWRVDLAEHLHKQARFIDRQLNQRELNHLVQRTIDRIVFLRIAEDRNLESYGRLERAASIRRGVYNQIKQLYLAADRRYNSGLFHFDPADKSRPDADTLSMEIYIVDNVLRRIIGDLYPPRSRYQFSVISADILGQVYERFLGKVIEVHSDGETTSVTVEEKPEVRKAGGVYYTPSYIVDYIVENTVGALLKDRTPDETMTLRVLDPACGSGSFLTGAYDYLLDWHLTQYQQAPERYRNRLRRIVGGYVLDIREKRRILLDNIYGVDLDQNAVEVSKLSLLLKMLENEHDTLDIEEPLLPDLSGNIKWGNSLIGSDFFTPAELAAKDDEELYRVKPFDWAGVAGFGEIMGSGGFDAVIGNPPYGAALDANETEYLLANYRLQNYQLDTYMLFVEKSISLAREGGLIGVIIPNTWLLILMSSDIRKYLTNNTTIVNIVHYMNYVFKDATVDTQVNVFLNSLPQENHEVRISIVTKSDEIIEYKVPQSVWKKRDGQPINIFFRAEFQQIVNRVNHLPKLDNLFKTTLGAKPFQTGKGKPKQTRETVRLKPYVSEVAKDETFRPLLRGRLIHRYQNKWAENYYISFGDWLAEPRYSANYDAPQKIVIRQTGDSLIATLDDEQFVVRNNLYTIVQREHVSLSLKYLLGLLNSGFFRWYYQRVINYEVGEALAEVKRGHIAQLPIRAIDFDNPADVAMHDEVVALVDTMLSLHKQLPELAGIKREVIEAQIESTDREIDALVYRLYGLSEDEVGVVEGG